MVEIPILATTLRQAESALCGGLVFDSIAPRGQWTKPGAVSLSGICLSGSYQDVLSQLPEQKDSTRAAIVIFAHGNGMEAFLDGFDKLMTGVPLAGGAAARKDTTGRGMVLPPSQDLALLLITEGDWEAKSILFHRPTGCMFRALGKELRGIETISHDGEIYEAIPFLEKIAEEHGVTEAVWERAALLTDGGRLLHMSRHGAAIHIPANLEPSRSLELAIFDEDRGRDDLMRHLPSDGFLFGCAGLNGLIEGARPWEEAINTCYLYGEALTLDGRSVFANLSMSLLFPKND